MRRSTRNLCTLATLGVAAHALWPLKATANNWVPTAGGAYNFNTASNWNPASVPTFGTANHQIDITGDQTINVSSATTLGTINLGDTTLTSGVYSNQSLTGSTITFGSGGSGAINNIRGANSIANAMQLTAFTNSNGLTVDIDSGTLTLSGSIAGAAGVTYNGSFGTTIFLSATNTYSGPTIVPGAVLVVPGPSSFGNAGASNTITIGSFSVYRFAAGFTEPRNITVTNHGTEFDTNGFDASASGVISSTGEGGFVKTGAGTLTLTNSNTGKLIVDAGTLRVTSSASLGAAFVELSGGTLQLGAAISDSHGYNVTSASTIDTAGFDSTLTGQLGFPGTSKVTKAGLGSLTLGYASNSVTSLTIAAGVLRASVDGNLGSATGLLTLDGGTLQPTASFAAGRPLKVGSSGGAIDLNAQTLTFQSTGNNTFSGALTLSSSGTLNLNRTGGTVVITPGASITVGPPSTFNLGGTVDALSDGTNLVNVVNNNATSGFNVTANTKNVGDIDGPGKTTVSNGASLIANHVRQSSVAVNDTSRFSVRSGLGNASTSTLAALPAVASTARFDLNDARIIIQFGTNASPLAAARNAIIKGRGGTGFANASWNGGGGITSLAASAAGGGDGVSLALGYVENSFLPSLGLPTYTTFGGQSADSGSLLIRFTRGADANLDGRVNTDDITILGATYNSAVSGEWFLGDFDYDGICDSDDITVLGALYDATAPALSSSQLTAQYGSDFAAAFARGQALGAAVPEPASLSIVGIGGVALMTRRRKRKI